MAKFLNFFPRQMVGGGTAVTSLYSAPVEVGEATSVEAELRIFAASGMGINFVSGIIETTYDPFLVAGWADYGTACSGSVAGNYPVTTASAPKRFARARVVMPSGGFAMVSFSARAFC